MLTIGFLLIIMNNFILEAQDSLTEIEGDYS